ncbi:EAL and HDOD domain-containing protein [Marinomonas posidonica]|uniref:Signal transduction protein n=1 Tax=Marinomonas posidonica (strain CECT 7376 / NCIMB 14433 / IVIA-Po-181) TaxID=491952 RepID=F6D0I3_MARPP|nr:HDOD domain-containing protein [Marinomonas posidonica]AEF54781.1 putative signal transduction protein [Marinomonas posidonica IVIA-Po-181]
MKNDDVLFCRKAVVNQKSQTMAYHLLHPEDTLYEDEKTFFSSLFVDVNLNELTQQKAIFFIGSIDQLTKLPELNGLQVTLFIDCSNLDQTKHIDSLSEARLDGYQFGLVNPQPEDYDSDFMNVFSYVLYDLEQISLDEVLESSQHPDIVLKNIWVHKIERAQDFDRLKQSLPHAYFSGCFIRKMTKIKGKRVLAYKDILIELLNHLNNHQTSPRLLADCIERDPTLTYRIIKLTHTARYHSQFNVTNAQRAVEIIGVRDLVKWVGLVMLSSVSGKPDCLFLMAVSRACFCHNISAVLFPKLEGGFLVGLFSYLPSFYDEDLTTLLKELPLDVNITKALLEYQGNLGGVLRMVEAYESGRWEKIPFDQLAMMNISKDALKNIYIDSLTMAREMTQA